MSACSQCAASEKAICRSLSPGELDDLVRIGRHQTVAAGQTLQWQGGESLIVGNVVAGMFKLSASTADGRDQTLGIMVPSDFIGRPFGATSDHSIVALTESRVCTFPRKAFEEFAHKHPPLQHQLLKRTLTELDRTRTWMLLLNRKSAAERVAAFLLEIACRLGVDGDGAKPIRFRLPFGRQDVADLLGLTIETVSRQITHLRANGIIDTPDRRSIVVLDRAELEDRAGG